MTRRSSRRAPVEEAEALGAASTPAQGIQRHQPNSGRSADGSRVNLDDAAAMLSPGTRGAADALTFIARGATNGWGRAQGRQEENEDSSPRISTQESSEDGTGDKGSKGGNKRQTPTYNLETCHIVYTTREYPIECEVVLRASSSFGPGSRDPLQTHTCKQSWPTTRRPCTHAAWVPPGSRCRPP